MSARADYWAAKRRRDSHDSKMAVRYGDDEVRPLPTPEAFIRFLVEHEGDVTKAGHAARRLVQIYAATWANVEGVNPGRATREAEELFDSVTTSAQQQLEESL